MIVCILLLAPSGIHFVSSCGPVLDPEDPVFQFEIGLPVNGDSTAAELTVQPGTQAVVPITIISTRDESVEVSLDIDREEGFPDAITITVPEGYVFVAPGERVTVDIVYNVGGIVTPGLYHTFLTGNLKEPIEEKGGIAQAIDIIVTEIS